MDVVQRNGLNAAVPCFFIMCKLQYHTEHSMLFIQYRMLSILLHQQNAFHTD